MATIKHGKCKRGVRPQLGSIGRPNVARRETVLAYWRLIAQGATSEQAGIAVGVSPVIGARWFRQGGGMPFIDLTHLSGRYLDFHEREQIALLKAEGHCIREIARRLGRDPSTISRELRRNAATRSGYVEYRASTAQWHRDRRAKRPKAAKLVVNARLKNYVQDRLAGAVRDRAGRPIGPRTAPWNGRGRGRRQDRRWARAWSPQQIANRLCIDFPEDASMRISHEAIYQALYIRGRGALQQELTSCLRTGRALRMPRARVRGRGKHFVTADVALCQRPLEVANRVVPGHWEGDLILGLGSSAIGTVVERSTRFALLLHLPRLPGHGGIRERDGPALAGHGADAVRHALATALGALPACMRKTLTWDQGSEMSQHIALRQTIGTQIYFCDPRSPWQRGSNENFNGLLRHVSDGVDPPLFAGEVAVSSGMSRSGCELSARSSRAPSGAPWRYRRRRRLRTARRDRIPVAAHRA
ncbi:MAG: IS30 family transposase [Rubrivivax sp.]